MLAHCDLSYRKIIEHRDQETTYKTHFINFFLTGTADYTSFAFTENQINFSALFGRKRDIRTLYQMLFDSLEI